MLFASSTALAAANATGQPTSSQSPELQALIAAGGGGFSPAILNLVGGAPDSGDGNDGLPHINTRLGGPESEAGVGEVTVTSACQPPAQSDEEWGFWLVESDFYGEYYERTDFFQGDEGFDEIQVSGFQVGFEGGFVSCGSAELGFRVRIYSDLAGEPGTLLMDEQVNSTGVPGPMTYAGTEATRLYTWSLPLSAPQNIQRGWLSIQAIGGDCYFGQLTSVEGTDSHSLFKNGASSTWASQGFDLNYCLISHAPTAPACQVASQPNENWGFWLTDGVFGPRAERFQVDGVIGSVDLTGTSVAWNGVAWQSCNDFTEEFHVTFHADDNGSIGEQVSEFTLTTTGTPTGTPYFWSFPFISRTYQLQLPVPLQLYTGWLEIEAVAAPGCWFAWLNSQNGDGSSLVWNNNTQTWRGFNQDFAFCLNTIACPPVNDVRMSHLNGTLTLSWDAIPGATDYRILTAKTPYEPFTALDITTGGSTTWSVSMDSGMEFYKIVAVCP
ncbi:MAG: hypothetical protein H6678_08600 [Candidatus Delongbacteria bacterium]|nr:hypothetical protein [Candidatus Delongbacteria bacterium]